MSHRIAIVGVGEVGAATAFAILLDSLCDELLLVDTNIDKRDGQVQDLSDAACCRNSSTKVRAASYEEAGCCDIVIVTLGTKHRIGTTIFLHP
jgi:L-lactate dehydrogenase